MDLKLVFFLKDDLWAVNSILVSQFFNLTTEMSDIVARLVVPIALLRWTTGEQVLPRDVIPLSICSTDLSLKWQVSHPQDGHETKHLC